MKKHNEGYTLVLVMLVLVVLCLLAGFILTTALRNLEAQQSAAQQIQDRYAAQGELEKIVAQYQQDETFLEGNETDADGYPVLTVTAGSVQITCVIQKADDGEIIYRSYEISLAGGDTE